MSEFDGNKARKLIDERGLRLNWIAKKVGVNQSTVTRWLSDESTPRADKMLALANLLGVRPEELFKESAA